MVILAPPVLFNLRMEPFVERLCEVAQGSATVQLVEADPDYLATGYLDEVSGEGRIDISESLVYYMKTHWWCRKGPNHRAAALAYILTHEMAHVIDPRPSRAKRNSDFQRNSHGQPFWRRVRDLSFSLTDTYESEWDSSHWGMVRYFLNWPGFDAYVERARPKVPWPTSHP